jgi:hypothetical protein
MATVIDSVDLNRYEVIKTRPMNTEATNVAITGQPIQVTTDPGISNKSTAVDAFGRARVSNPLTLFDSSHRYRDNNLWSSLTASGGTATFNANQGLIDLAVTTTSGSKVYRETTKVFSYQPGKSLLIMTTFVLNAAKTNLRQRVGYYGAANGYFLELDGTSGNTLALVERSSVSGSLVETKVSSANWNVDTMDGTGPSKITLGITKAQILWMDVEWLGLGTVRLGFVIDGKFILCHQFHHANLVSSTYITTASLPIRYEVENTGTTSGSSTLKQICSTVISEGGYELRGLQQSIGTSITAPATLSTAGTKYPVISIRLKSSPNRLDAIVILTALSFLGLSNNAHYNWSVVATGTTTGGTWVSAGTDSAVEYNLTGTSFSGGRILAQGYSSASNQSSNPVDILKEALFKFQLERDGFANTAYELTLVAAGSTTNASLHASVDWEEISR